MKVSVVVEQISGNGYRATGQVPLTIAVEAATCDEALTKLKEQLQEHLHKEADSVTLDVSSARKHPWMEFAGMFKDDPLVEEWKSAMAEYRDKVESDPNYF